jgi:hypothetical protein
MAVIDAVSLTLKAVLDAALDPLLPAANEPFAEVHDLQGTVPTNPARVTLFLYDVLEDPSARNRPRVRGEVPPDISLRKPRVALLLRYLITPFSTSRETDQAMLTRVVQSFYDGAIISGPLLHPDLANTDTVLKVTLAQLSLEDRTRVWNSLQRPYRLSVVYEARVANVDTLTQQTFTPVSRRSLEFARPESTA